MAEYLDESADMESLDDVAKPQSYIFGCELKAAKKEYRFNPEEDDDHAEMHLVLNSVCLAPEAEDQFHVVEVTTIGKGGKPVTIPIATLKPSVLPSLSLSGFDLAAPVVLALKCGSGPVYVSGQHVAYPCSDFLDDDDDDLDEENDKMPMLAPASGKRPSPFKVPQVAKKKTKLESDEDDEDDDDYSDLDEDEDDDDLDDDDDDDDEDEVPTKKAAMKAPALNKAATPGPKVNGASNKKPEPTLAKTPSKVDKTPAQPSKTPSKMPAKVVKTPAKADKTPAKAAIPPGKTEQASVKKEKSGLVLKTPKGSTEPPKKGEDKQAATPGAKTPKSPKSPKGPLSLEEVKTKLKEQIAKNMGMPKTEEKFGNFVKSSFKVEDTKVIKELWSWSLTQHKS